MRTPLISLLSLLALLPGAARAEDATPPPSPSALLFGKKCGSCHTLGEGDRTGPDLLGVTTRRDHKWIASFVRNPGAAIDGGDAVATELLAKFKNVRMPEQLLNDEEMTGLIDYLSACTQAGGCKLALGKVKHASQATPAEIEQGRRIFEGTQPLLGGGPSCISCHNVRGAGLAGGGTIAKDLTFVYARLGDAPLGAALDTTPFPVMKDVFAGRPLREGESFALKAYLATVAKDGTAPRPDRNFIYLGVLGLFLSLGAIGAGGARRLRGVRRALVEKARTKSQAEVHGGHAR